MRVKVAIGALLLALVAGVAALIGLGRSSQPVPTANEAKDEAGTAKGPLWSKSCAQDQAGKELCYVEQFAIGNPGNVVLLHMRFGYLGPNGSPRLVAAMPLGVMLAPGITLALDQEKPLTMPFTRCVEGGCLAIADLDADALTRFTDGKVLAVRYVGPDNKTVDIPVQLAGLAQALKGVPAAPTKP